MISLTRTVGIDRRASVLAVAGVETESGASSPLLFTANQIAPKRTRPPAIKYEVLSFMLFLRVRSGFGRKRCAILPQMGPNALIEVELARHKHASQPITFACTHYETLYPSDDLIRQTVDLIRQNGLAIVSQSFR